MKKVDINKILTDVLSVVFNNEGSNSPEDITDYVDSETILDYMLEDNDYFLSNFLTYLESAYMNGKYPCDDGGKCYYNVLFVMIRNPHYKEKCQDFMTRYGFDLDIINRDFL